MRNSRAWCRASSRRRGSRRVSSMVSAQAAISPARLRARDTGPPRISSMFSPLATSSRYNVRWHCGGRAPSLSMPSAATLIVRRSEMSPRIGYLLPTREQVMEGRPAAAPLLALAERAEGLGYDSLWVGDSILARPRHEPLSLLAAVAARTRRAELGTAVLLPALRNPVVLAHQVATLDQISEGRFILGVGIASDVPNIRAEFVACGVPFEHRVGRMLDGLRLMRALWTGEPVSWNGRWWSRTRCSGRCRTAPAGRRSGSAAWCGRRWNAPASISTAGSPTARRRRAGASNGARCRRSPARPGATRRAWSARST